MSDADRSNDRKLTLAWVQQRDGSRALVFDAGAWAAFQRAANAQDKTARTPSAPLYTECVGSILMGNYTLNRFLK